VADPDDLLRLKCFALDRVHEAVYLIDRDARFVFVNEQAHRALGYRSDEFLRMTVMDIDPAWGLERWRAVWEDLRAKGVLTFETTHRRKDGSLVPVEITTSCFESAGKEYNVSIARDIASRRDAHDITERKGAQQRLHASEQAFRAVVEHSPDYIARYDLAYRRVYMNPAIVKLMHRPLSEVLGTTPQENSTLVDVSSYLDRLRQVVETGKEAAAEVRFHGADGQVRWAHMRIIPEFAPNGEVASVLAIGRDIDELKRSEQLFRTLTENFPDFIARFDKECRHLYVNPAVSTALAIPQQDFIGKRLHELPAASAAGQNELIEAGIRRAFEQGVPNKHEAQWRTTEGWRVFEVRHVPEKDSDGTVVSVLSIARDITRLRQAELALSDSERAFRTLAENAPDPIVRYDCRLRCIYVNPEYLRVVDRKARDVLGKSALEASDLPPRVADALARKLRKVVERGMPAKHEFTWDRCGKTTCWFLHAVPEYGEYGQVQTVLTVWRDITERKEAEHRLRESYEMLRKLGSRRETAREEERKRIARELHDELGQQLTALRMGASTLRMRFGHDNPAVADDIQNLLLIADKTMQVVRNVVASLRPAVLDAGIVAALEWLCMEFSRNSHAVCHFCVPEEHVPLAEEGSIAFFRIVQEALTNVVRHAKARHVFVTLDYSGDNCVLDIRDDGRGFNPVASRRKSFGLAGMKERVSMLGGTIAIASSPGRGSAITVRVPVRRAAGASRSGA
jgi:PAS domain S-box-containing protein